MQHAVKNEDYFVGFEDKTANEVQNENFPAAVSFFVTNSFVRTYVRPCTWQIYQIYNGKILIFGSHNRIDQPTRIEQGIPISDLRKLRHNNNNPDYNPNPNRNVPWDNVRSLDIIALIKRNKAWQPIVPRFFQVRLPEVQVVME